MAVGGKGRDSSNVKIFLYLNSEHNLPFLELISITLVQLTLSPPLPVIIITAKFCPHSAVTGVPFLEGDRVRERKLKVDQREGEGENQGERQRHREGREKTKGGLEKRVKLKDRQRKQENGECQSGTKLL